MAGRRPRRFGAFAAFWNLSERFRALSRTRAAPARPIGSELRGERQPFRFAAAHRTVPRRGTLSPIGDRHVYPPLGSRSCGACEPRNRRDLRFRVGPRQVRILRRPSPRRRFRRRSDSHLHAAAHAPVRNGCSQSAAVAAAALASTEAGSSGRFRRRRTCRRSSRTAAPARWCRARRIPATRPASPAPCTIRRSPTIPRRRRAPGRTGVASRAMSGARQMRATTSA
jgi:hypothetical protein